MKPSFISLILVLSVTVANATNTGGVSPLDWSSYFTTTKPLTDVTEFINKVLREREEKHKQEEADRMRSLVLAARNDAIQYIATVREGKEATPTAALSAAVRYFDPRGEKPFVEVVEAIIIQSMQYE